MSTRNRLAAVVLCAGGVATLAHAQPTAEDLGALSNGTISRSIAMSTNQVFWYKFTVPAVNVNSSGPGSVYLDIRTHNPGGTVLDTEIALYNATGTLATPASTDDDDGPGNGSALSYGMVCPTRANAATGTQGAGANFDGRDGGLAPGEYYLVVAPFNASFSGTNCGVSPGSQTGPMMVEITLGEGVDPLTAPSLTAGTASTNIPGSSTTVTVTAAACGMPTDVSLDASTIGAASNIPMFDNGTNGDATANDRIFTAVVTIPAGATPGAYNLTANASNSAGPTSRVVALTVQAPPATLTASGGVYTEIEDNNNKTRANIIQAMNSGEAISGTTTGTSTTATGNGSADYFRVTTAAAPLGIYRHRLQITTTGTAGHSGTIRGLSQSSTGITAGTDVEMQATSTATTPARFNQWYGFGKGETVFYRVNGGSGTTAPFSSTLSTDSVTPVALGTFAPGQIVLTTVGQGHTEDTEILVYDASLNPVPGYMNDDESVAEGGADTSRSRLVRNYDAGTYYVAISTYNTANNQPSPATDDFRTGNVLDFANAIIAQSTSAAANMQFAVTDSTGTQTFPASKAAYDIYWATFTVGSSCPGNECGPQDFNGDGDAGTDQDIEAFFACLGGTCCETCFCQGSDFNGDGDIGTDQDIEAFFRVLGGSPC